MNRVIKLEIKLVVSDLDGTLLNKDESLSDEVIATIRKLDEKGIPFTIATGRLKYMIDEYAEKMAIKHPIVSCNGSILYKETEILSENTFSIKPLRKLIEKANEMGMTIVYSIQGKEYVLKETTWVLEKRKKFDRYHDVHYFTEDDWSKVVVDKVNIVDEIRDGRVRELHPYSDNLEKEFAISHYGNVGMEIVAGGITKAIGLQELSKQMGIPMENIMAIGDSENDNAMLKVAGLGVAVGNAMPSTKENADYICEGHGPVGVIEAIEKFVLKEAYQ